jgi:predicted transcriptional regulator
MTNNEPTKLSGTISYEITLSPDGYSVQFKESNDLDSIKNALASTSMVRSIAKSTIEEMERCKKEDRPFFNKNYKNVYWNCKRTLRELETLESGIVADLLEVTVVTQSAIASAEKAPTEPVITVQNPVIEE